LAAGASAAEAVAVSAAAARPADGEGTAFSEIIYNVISLRENRPEMDF